jgi:hypothetical protein
MKNSFYLFAFALLSTAVFAQQKPVATSIDKNKNKIGAEFKVTYKTSVDTLQSGFPEPQEFRCARSHPVVSN